jgi:hypothetical protein
MRTGVCGFDCSWVLGNHLGIGDVYVASGIGAGKSPCANGLQVISGMLPGMLFLVHCKCVCFVRVRVHFAVGLGAAIMSCASVICCRGAALAW